MVSALLWGPAAGIPVGAELFGEAELDFDFAVPCPAPVVVSSSLPQAARSSVRESAAPVRAAARVRRFKRFIVCGPSVEVDARARHWAGLGVET